MKKKTLTIAIALVLVVALAVGATYAYLTAKTGEVKNTFVVGALGNSNLTLQEHKVTYNKANGTYAEGEWQTTGQNYIVQPGVNIPKDPTVTLSNLDVNTGAYVFVGVKGTATPTFSWSVDNAVWIPVVEKDGTPVMKGEYQIYTLKAGVVTATEAVNSTSWNVLKAGTDGTEITVSNNFALAEGQNADSLNIDVIAFACQAAGFDNAAAAFTACFGK